MLTDDESVIVRVMKHKHFSPAKRRGGRRALPGNFFFATLLFVLGAMNLLVLQRLMRAKPSCEVRDDEQVGVQSAYLSHWPPYEGPPAEVTDKLTVVVNSFKRRGLLKRTLRHYERCGNVVDSIHAVWSEDMHPPSEADDPEYYSDKLRVWYVGHKNTSLNNRFKPVPGLRTEAVYSVDDDIYAPCSALEKAFRQWQGDKRNLVGFHPRTHVDKGRHPSGLGCEYHYPLRLGTIWWRREFSIILTKAAILHRDYFTMYTHHLDYGFREHVDRGKNCEDIAMQFLVANVTGRQPVLVHALGVQDAGQGPEVKGISSGKRHQETRSECLGAFSRLFGGRMPLRNGPLSPGWFQTVSILSAPLAEAAGFG